MWEALSALGGVLGGVFITLVVQHIQAIYQRDNYRREKLQERYAEFAALLSLDIERSKDVDSIIISEMCEPDVIVRLEQRRHELRRELGKVALQIRLLEPDQELSGEVAKLARSQPFRPLLLPPRWGQGNYDERAREFSTAIREFEKEVDALTERVVRKHREVW